MKRTWLIFTLVMVLAAVLRFCFVACDYIAYTLAFFALLWAARQGLQKISRQRPKLARRLGVLMTIGLWILGLWFAATEVYLISGARTETEPNPAYIVVLGAQVRGDEPSRSMSDRVAAAAEYLADHPDTVCIVSGGQGPGENRSEAVCMQEMLLSVGIEPHRVWLEDRATNTEENIAFSLELIEQTTGQRPEQLGIVSSEYHLRRADLVVQRQGCDGVRIAARTSLPLMKLNYFIREAFGIWYYALLK